MTALTFAATTIKASGSTTGTVWLSQPAATETVVTLLSSHNTATVPASVTVPQGAQSASFQIEGFGIVRDARVVSALITATLGAESRQLRIAVLQRR